MLEQKVYVQTSGPLYPNLYIFLVGHAGIGKSRTITAASGFVRELPEIHLGATSMTMASLVDHMSEAKRSIMRLPEPLLEYNSLYIAADELSAFMHDYKGAGELIGGLTTFYDVVPYAQGRRTRDIRIKIARPQLNMLMGTTPANLDDLIPIHAWGQGFTSRIILVYAHERPYIDVFNTQTNERPADMIHDLKVINTLAGRMGWTDEYADAMNNWKKLGQKPVPTYPKLEHYSARRFAFMLKLSMIASVDRGNDLMLRTEDFNRAMLWLLDAELHMPKVFQGGAGTDSKVMDEIRHFVEVTGPKGMSEHKIMNYARERVPAYNVKHIVDVMEAAGMIKAVANDPRTGLRIFIVPEE